MKLVILAGGFGTRISEETRDKPKPMILIGQKPILWHIMKKYSMYGINDFIICCGYKSEVIKNYFLNEFKIIETFQANDYVKLTIYTDSGNWSVTLADTGINTMTGGRLKRVEKLIGNDTFHFTYGDTLNDLDIIKLEEFHKKNNATCTVTACKPPEKYGVLIINNNRVEQFKEKPVREDWINGGYFILEPSIFELLHGDETIWEKEPLETLVRNKKLYAYKHYGFYQPMDTISERDFLNNLWNSGNAPWKIWK